MKSYEDFINESDEQKSDAFKQAEEYAKENWTLIKLVEVEGDPDSFIAHTTWGKFSVKVYGGGTIMHNRLNFK